MSNNITPITGDRIGTVITTGIEYGLTTESRSLTWADVASVVIGCEETISNLQRRIDELKVLQQTVEQQATTQGWNRSEGYQAMHEEAGDFRVKMPQVTWSAEGLIEWDSI